MKKVRLLFPILLLMCICACTNKPYPQSLRVADSLIHNNPDSAVILLEELKRSMAFEPQATQMYYQLLTIKAKDKAYITHTSDSLIQTVVKYYEERKDRERLPDTYYYAGRVYRALGDATQALEYLQQAIESTKDCTDYRLISRIYSQTGTLYLYQDTYDQALEVFRKAYQYCLSDKDSIGMVYSLRDIGRTFTTLNCADSALYYYKGALNYAEQIHNNHLVGVVQAELSGLYIQLEMYPEAFTAIQCSNKYIKGHNIAPFYAILADYYYYTNQLDSATFYYTQTASFDDLYQKQGSYKGLGNIARKKGQYKEAMEYFDKYLICTDSIKDITNTETIRKMQSLYNYQLKEKENSRLQHQAANYKLWNILLVFSLLSLVFLFIAYHQFRKKKEQQRLVKQERIKQIQKDRYAQSNTYLEKNKEQIKVLELSLHKAEIEKDQLRQDLLKAQKSLIEKTNEQITATQRVQKQSELALKHSDIYKKFHFAVQGSDEKIGNDDWKELMCAVDEAYNQFTTRLLELYPMKTIEIQVCVLIKIGLSPAQIAFITIRSRQAISSIRKRLYSKVMGKDGTPEQWDIFISTF